MDYKKSFVVDSSEIEGRLDPLYYSGAIYGFIKKLQFNLVKIKSISKNINSGIGAGKQDQTDKKNGILQIRPTNIDKYNQLRFDKNIYIPKSDKLKILQKNNVLFNNTNSQELVGKTSFFDINEEMTFSNHITKIEVDQDIIEAKYLYLILNIYQENKIFYNLCTNWNNQSGVGIALLKNLKIPLPPKETQNKIIQIMDNAYKIKKENEKRAKELLASIDTYLLDKLDITLPKEEKIVSFQVSSSDIFGDRYDPKYHTVYNKMKKECFKYGKYESQIIKDIFSITRGRVISKQYIDNNKGIYPIYSSQTLNNGVFGKIKTYDFDGEYITWTTDGIYAGTCTYRSGKFNCTNICGTLKAKIQNINLRYISDILNQITNEYVTKVANPKLMSNIMATIKIPIPPLKIQNEIANHIKELREKASYLKKEAKDILKSAKDEVEAIILEI
jgi:restriction endonuclease S subunit